MNELTDRDESGLGWVYPPQPQQTFIEEIIGLISGVIELVEAQDYIDVVFGSAQPTADWVLIEASIFNTTDGTPINIWPGVLTSKTTTGFRLQLNGTPDSGNYFLNWSIRGVFGYYLSGPISGQRNVASSPFTVRLPNESTLTGTVIITPTDGGVGGTFTPATVALTVAAPSATFTYTPSTYGARSISCSNDRGLVNPVEIGFTSVASTYTLDGPSGGNIGEASTNFTVALPFGSSVLGSVTITPDDGGDGGTFTPTTVELTTIAPSATFTYTPASVGDKTISTTNDGGMTDPVDLTYTSVLDIHLLDTLISYWKLDEASGTRVDSHGTNDLTDNGGIGSATGIINNGVLGTGVTGQFLSKTSNTSLQVTSDFTFSCWIKLTSQASQFIFLKYDGVNLDYAAQYTAAEGFAFQVANGYGSPTDYAKIGSATSNGVWTHLVMWFDSGSGQVYLRINDTTTYASTTAPALLQTTAGFTIAASLPGGGLPADSVIDEVGFWKRKLNPGEINALYNSGAGLDYGSFTA